MKKLILNIVGLVLASINLGWIIGERTKKDSTAKRVFQIVMMVTVYILPLLLKNDEAKN